MFFQVLLKLLLLGKVLKTENIMEISSWQTAFTLITIIFRTFTPFEKNDECECNY